MFFAGTEFHAEIVTSLLRASGIPAQVWTSGLGAHYGHASPGFGGVPFRVMVREEDADAAREVIAAEAVPEEEGPA